MKHVLVAAASSELASEVIPKLLDGEYRIGLHYSSNKKAVEPYEEYEQVKLIQCTIAGESDCARIVDEYVEWAGSIDSIVIFLGHATGKK